MDRQETLADDLQRRWATDPRWAGVRRDYTARDVLRLRGTVPIECTLARRGAQRLWDLLHSQEYLATFGALTGLQAVQMVRAGLKAIYISGWQVAADANLSGQTYPDLSLYPSTSVPALVRRVTNALLRAAQIDALEGRREREWLVPLVADAEAGFGGPLNAFELTRELIEAGAAAVHLEDQLAAEKKCGHLGGKVLVPVSQFLRTLRAARLAADILDVPTLLIARTDARDAPFLTSDVDPEDREFLTGERTPEGYFRVRHGLDYAIHRALRYAPYAEMLWFETSRPDLEEARRFAEAVHAHYPGKLLAYNLSPSFNWTRDLDREAVKGFMEDLARLGYRFQFITLAGWHLLTFHTFAFARSYLQEGMPAYVRLQEQELAWAQEGYTAVRHQQEVGTGYFDRVLLTLTEGRASTAALSGSTEAQQF